MNESSQNDMGGDDDEKSLPEELDLHDCSAENPVCNGVNSNKRCLTNGIVDGSVSEETESQSEINNKPNGETNGDISRVVLAAEALQRAKSADDKHQYEEALFFYRQGIDLLLDELFLAEGTPDSRSYLQNKCNQFMDRVDELKIILYKNDPLPPLQTREEIFVPFTSDDILSEVLICVKGMVDCISDAIP